jgi:hypothetical protein
METGDMADVNVALCKVKKKIRNLKTSSAAGPDGIWPRLLQELENEIPSKRVMSSQSGNVVTCTGNLCCGKTRLFMKI